MPYKSVKIEEEIVGELRGLRFPGESLSHMLQRLLPALRKGHREHISAFRRQLKGTAASPGPRRGRPAGPPGTVPEGPEGVVYGVPGQPQGVRQ